jgi:hypothetical protein
MHPLAESVSMMESSVAMESLNDEHNRRVHRWDVYSREIVMVSKATFIAEPATTL